MADTTLSVSMVAQARSLLGAFREVYAQHSGLERAQRRVEASTRLLNRRFDQMQQRLESMGQLTWVTDALGRTGDALTRFASAPIQTAAGFEQAMTEVRAITNATVEQFGDLTAEARRLGASTSFSASQAASGMKFLGMAGFDTMQIIEAMPAVLDLARAGSLDLGLAADISSDIMSAFGLQAADLTHVVDVLAATTTRSNTNVQMLGQSMKFVAPVAATAGASIEDVSALLGAMANSGIKASQGGTAARAIFLRLASASGEAADMLADLGIETTNLDGSMRPILDVLKELADATDGMGSGEQLQAFKTIFETEAAPAVAKLVAEMKAGTLQKFRQELNNVGGEGKRLAKDMADTTQGGWLELWSAVESLSISFGTLLLPAVRWVTGALRTATGWVDTLVQEFPILSQIVGIGALALGGLMVAVAGVGTAVAGILGTLVASQYLLTFLGIKSLGLITVFKGLSGVALALGQTVFPLVATGLRMIAAAAIANPIGAIIAVVAGAAALIIANWSTVTEWFEEKFPGLTEWIGGAFSTVGDWISWAWDMAKQFFDWFGGAYDAVAGFFGDDDEEDQAQPAAGRRRSSASQIVQTAEAARTAGPIVTSNGPPRPATASAAGDTVTHNVTINVQAAPGQDPRAIAQEVARIQDEQRRAALYD